MATSELAVWIDIAASLAVLVTLIFLVIQIRQTNALMRSEARQAQVINDQEHIYKFIQHPDIATSYSTEERIGDDEKTRLMFWIVASMRARENEWFQFKHGAWTRQPGLLIGRSYPLRSARGGRVPSGNSASLFLILDS